MSDIAIVWDPPNARGDWEIVPYQSEDVIVEVETPVVFGGGDGQTTDFQLWLPNVDVIPVVEADIYRTDWQGTQLLYATPRTNGLTYSNAFSNWGPQGVTLTPNAVTAPDGSLTAWHIADESAAQASKNLARSATTLNPATINTLSVFARAAEYDFILLRIGDEAVSSNYSYAIYDVSAGAVVGLSNVGNATGAAADIEPLPDAAGWYRCILTATPNPSEGTLGVSALVAAQPTASNGNNRTGTVGDGAYIFGAQLEAGAVATSYIPTTTAPVTVTDYVIGPTGKVSLSDAPVKNVVLSWSGSYLSRKVSGGYLETGDDIETALLLSLFTDRLAASDDQIPDGSTDRRGWWGDDANVDGLGPTGSRLWLLSRRTSPTDKTLTDAYDYVAEAIQWMVTTGVVGRFDINVQWLSNDALGILIAAWPPSGGAPVTYNWAWKAMS